MQTIDQHPILAYVPPPEGIDRIAIHIDLSEFSNSNEPNEHIYILDRITTNRPVGDDKVDPYRVQWRPKTYMNHYETPGLAVIDRGQGLGVVVVPHWRFYCKLVRDKEHRIRVMAITNYRDNNELGKMLSDDLAQGWDLLMIKADGSSENYYQPKGNYVQPFYTMYGIQSLELEWTPWVSLVPHKKCEPVPFGFTAQNSQ